MIGLGKAARSTLAVIVERIEPFVCGFEADGAGLGHGAGVFGWAMVKPIVFAIGYVF